jgi:hypothetical protein
MFESDACLVCTTVGEAQPVAIATDSKETVKEIFYDLSFRSGCIET